MPNYTYVRNVDPNNKTNAILLRNGGLTLRKGTYANLVAEEIKEIKGTGEFVLEEGIIAPATQAGGGGGNTPVSGTIFKAWAPNTEYKIGEGVTYEEELYVVKRNFVSGETFKF